MKCNDASIETVTGDDFCGCVLKAWAFGFGHGFGGISGSAVGSVGTCGGSCGILSLKFVLLCQVVTMS